MHSYKTLGRPNATTGALRSFDLLGQLPVRNATIASSDELHDLLALADDWQAVAEDLLEAVKMYSGADDLRDEIARLVHVLEESCRGEADLELTKALDRLTEVLEPRQEDVEERQMDLFEPPFSERAG